jgi:hypothetical protein
MSRVLSLLKKAFTIPFKLGIGTVLLGLGLMLGAYGPTIWTASRDALAWFARSTDGTFDPQILLNPERELRLIRSVESELEPSLRRAQILIRKQQAEIQYLREKSRFIEERVPHVAGDARTGETVLEELSHVVGDGEKAPREIRERFEQLQGPTWIALRTRSESLANSLQELLGLNERVQDLKGKLSSRRAVTLRLVPEGAKEENTVVRSLHVPEFLECKKLLEETHETLFKTIYSLDPAIINGGDEHFPGAQVSRQ